MGYFNPWTHDSQSNPKGIVKVSKGRKVSNKDDIGTTKANTEGSGYSSVTQEIPPFTVEDNF